MKKDLEQKIKIPEGVEINIEGNLISVTGLEGNNNKEFKFGKLNVKKEGNELIIFYKKATKKEKKQMNSIASHIKNMIQGVQKKFEYKLKVCFSHFPINVEIKDREIIIKNFLGEKISRVAPIPEGVEVSVEGQEIKITSTDKELTGQAAANIERATRITGRDRRVFQDGIFIINKAGREI